eukprot:CAMPEP_0176174916 /NCGR_PEP_ID=MMETSP0120_2-20121206/89611_1 /TAXON_ID=160619 /ORGANISM="Kryptoperidinium foliaceum, Strain CCMP 1326" /LENGTH=152 /DNA_ID=CAMNT_0017512955 /DNA_START=61 /DNA_END=515 /DNA_ORIENTATION=-
MRLFGRPISAPLPSSSTKCGHAIWLRAANAAGVGILAALGKRLGVRRVVVATRLCLATLGFCNGRSANNAMSGLDTAAVIATVLATVLAAAAACAAKADGFPPLHRVRGCGDDAFRDVNLAGNLRDFRTQSRRAHHLARQLRHDPGSEGLRR